MPSSSRSPLKRVSEQRSRWILTLLQRPWEGPEMKTTSACFRCQILTSQQVASYFSTKKYANPKRRLSSAGCLFHMCEIPAKFENNGFSKYSKGTSTWRKRQEKGLCYSSSLEACLWLSALSNSQRLLEEAWTYNYEGLRVLYFHSTINFGVSLEGWHLEFQYLNSDVLN